jgi:hypothetical protein
LTSLRVVWTRTSLAQSVASLTLSHRNHDEHSYTLQPVSWQPPSAGST